MSEFKYGKCAECPVLLAQINSINDERAGIKADQADWLSRKEFRKYLDAFDVLSQDGRYPVIDEDTQEEYTSAAFYALAKIEQNAAVCAIRMVFNQKFEAETQAEVNRCEGPFEEKLIAAENTTEPVFICSRIAELMLIQANFLPPQA